MSSNHNQTPGLAEVNISLMKPDVTQAEIDGFQAAVNPLLAIAKTMHGFRAVLEPKEGEIAPSGMFGDDRYLVNISVWDTVQDLGKFFRGPEHASALRNHEHLFTRLEEPALALWWVPGDHLPTIKEAEDRLRTLRAIGPSEYAFDLANAANFQTIVEA